MRTRPLCLILVLLILGLIIPLPLPAYAQTEVEVLVEQPDYTFGQQIRFQATIQSAEPIVKVLVLTQTGDQADMLFIPASVDSQGKISAVLDLRQQPLRAFSNVDYWYHVTFQNGETATSPGYSFYLEDNRFQWDSLTSPPFVAHWYTGDITFAQEVLNIAQAGLKRAQEFLPPVLVPETVNLYIYDDAQQLQTALAHSTQNWVAGHADPNLSVILVSLPPGPEKQLEMERQIPHELMHVLLYYTNADAYAYLPAWYNEGLASMAELYPNPDYQVLLQSAFETGGLLPIASLCQSFPTDASNAMLAYAEAASFTRFISDRFGMTRLEGLMAYYAQGVDCQRGVEAVLDNDLEHLDGMWRQDTFAENLWRSALENLLPWFTLLVIVLAVPVALAISMLRRKPVRMEL
ncbi:MAG TPA: peptidase MA family metallohydrolase [Anaerolineales bacterium]|nr:peptidase MA family metallohydrolase [Anaerolineales bacterium]